MQLIQMCSLILFLYAVIFVLNLIEYRITYVDFHGFYPKHKGLKMVYHEVYDAVELVMSDIHVISHTKDAPKSVKKTPVRSNVQRRSTRTPKRAGEANTGQQAEQSRIKRPQTANKKPAAVKPVQKNTSKKTVKPVKNGPRIKDTRKTEHIRRPAAHSGKQTARNRIPS